MNTKLVIILNNRDILFKLRLQRQKMTMIVLAQNAL
jgi:hypothetical protein